MFKSVNNMLRQYMEILLLHSSGSEMQLPRFAMIKFLFQVLFSVLSYQKHINYSHHIQKWTVGLSV